MSPTAPENPLVLAPGLLHGLDLPGVAGCFVSARSPLTGHLSQGWSEGQLGSALRRINLDLVTITGTAAEWAVIVLAPGSVTITTAGDLMGQDTLETTAALHAMYGRDAQILALGPAGESRVSYATPVVNGRYLIEPAGAGAVMAAKHIKAIVVRGGVGRAPHDLLSLRRLSRAIEQRSEQTSLAGDLRRFGSAAYINLLNDHGALTPRNGQDRVFMGMLALSRSTLALHGRQDAHGECPTHCHADIVGRSATPMPRPDLEALLGFGVRCDVADLETVLRANERCIRLGLDPTATSAAIAFLMECQQNGLHRTPALPWSDGALVLDLIEKIARKEGVGGVLSLGVEEMQSIFYGSDGWAPQAYGGALSPIDPRTLPIMQLHLATSTWPGDYRMAMPLSGLLPHAPDHLPNFRTAAPDPDVARLLWHERFAAVLDAFGLCRRWGLLAHTIAPSDVAELATAATGVAWTPAAMAKLGERILTLERLAITQNGVIDRLADRWHDRATLDRLLPLYYAAHGWDDEGLPTDTRIRALDLEPHLSSTLNS